MMICKFILILIVSFYTSGFDADEVKLKELYYSNHTEFYNFVRKIEKKAFMCSDLQEMIKWFDLENEMQGNAEFTEYFAEAIENLVIKKTTCVLDAMMLYKEADLVGFIKRNFSEPDFINKNEIIKAFQKQQKNEKYQKIVEKINSILLKDSHMLKGCAVSKQHP